MDAVVLPNSCHSFIGVGLQNEKNGTRRDAGCRGIDEAVFAYR
jgi:hypothetical protein